MKEKMKKKRNEFNISEGNLRVLELIPRLMTIPVYRDQLRMIVLNYITEQQIKRKSND